MNLEKGLQREEFESNILEYFGNLDKEHQNDLLYKLNVKKIQTQVDIPTQLAYYAEYELTYGEFGEEEAEEEIQALIRSSKSLGDIERLKYLTKWFKSQVKRGLFTGPSNINERG